LLKPELMTLAQTTVSIQPDTMTLLSSLGAPFDLQDVETFTHCQRIAGYALILGRRLGLSMENLLTLERGVFLHDMGNVHIPDRILKKTAPLSDAEWKVMKSHVVTGYAMLSTVPSLHDVAAIVLAHHERYNGTGYPHRLEGEDIPFGARICAVADCLDALTSLNRIRRRPMSFSDACRYIASERETRFDPRIVDAMVSVSTEEWCRLQRSVSPPCIPRMHEDGNQPSFRELVFSAHFDKLAAKVVAC
jgi:putative two-component system response regulator